jgi:pyruvate dehydrogenase E1 component alpha subunit
MPEKVISDFSVKHLSILDEKGNVDDSLMPPLNDDQIRDMYRRLLFTRLSDQYALSLQREGRIGTYPPALGQEAAQVGSAFAIQKADWVFPTYREIGVYLTLGYPLHLLLQYWAGDERGLKIPDDLNIFPFCIPIGTHVPHAVGAAMGAKLKKKEIAVITYFGDGATSKGDFHEGLNMAGVFNLPLVAICENNQWAISMPREKQTASKTIAQKALAYGFEGLQVDGNDILAVYKSTNDAINKAKAGQGPTLIECFTYRMKDHTTADDAGRYRSKEEVDTWKEKDPILRLRLYMERKGLLTGELHKKTEENLKRTIEDEIKRAESADPAQPKDIFLYTYKNVSQRQLKQMEGI